MFKKILLCTHGSRGARRAENLVFEKMVDHLSPEDILVLTVIDSDWSEMSSDDWLNTSTARTQFKDYVQEQLGREIDEDWARLKNKYPAAGKSRFLKVVGPVEATICEVAEKTACDLIVVGPFCRKPRRLTSLVMERGLADTVSNKKLHPALPCPLLTAP